MTVPVCPAEQNFVKETIATARAFTTTTPTTRANERFAQMEIPTEIAKEVSRYLTIDDIRACILACSRWHKSLKALLWRNLYLQVHNYDLQVKAEKFDGVKVTEPRIERLCSAIRNNELIDELASVEQLWLELPLAVCEVTNTASNNASGITRLNNSIQAYWLLQRLNRRRLLSLRKINFISEERCHGDNADISIVSEILHRFPMASAHITVSLNSPLNYPIFGLGISHGNVVSLTINCDQLPTANALYGTGSIPSSVKKLKLMSRRHKFESHSLRDLLVESMVEVLTVEGDIVLSSWLGWLPRSLRRLVVAESFEGHSNHVAPLILPNLRELSVKMVSGCIFDQILPLGLERLDVHNRLGDKTEQPGKKLSTFLANYRLKHVQFSGFSTKDVAKLICSSSPPMVLTLEDPLDSEAEEGCLAFSDIYCRLRVLILKGFDQHRLTDLLDALASRHRDACILVGLKQVYSEPWLTPYDERIVAPGFKHPSFMLDYENCKYWQVDLGRFRDRYQHKTTVERALDSLKLNLFSR